MHLLLQLRVVHQMRRAHIGVLCVGRHVRIVQVLGRRLRVASVHLVLLPSSSRRQIVVVVLVICTCLASSSSPFSAVTTWPRRILRMRRVLLIHCMAGMRWHVRPVLASCLRAISILLLLLLLLLYI